MYIHQSAGISKPPIFSGSISPHLWHRGQGGRGAKLCATGRLNFVPQVCRHSYIHTAIMTGGMILRILIPGISHYCRIPPLHGTHIVMRPVLYMFDGSQKGLFNLANQGAKGLMFGLA